MSLLTRPAPSRASATDASTRSRTAPLHSPIALGALAAVQAVVGGLLCLVAPVVALWVASTRTDARWSDAVRVAADGWLLAHHTGISVDGGYIGLTPLGLTLLPVAWCWAAGSRMATALGLTAPGGAPRGSGARALSAFTATYAVLAVVVSLLAASPVARPVSGQALLGAAVVAAGAAGAGLLRAARRPASPTPWKPVTSRLPDVVRRVLPAAVVAVSTWLAAAAALVALAVGLGWEGVVAAHDALRAGPVGGAGLLLAQLAVLPVAVVWAGTWLAGPGFSVGAGTAVTPWFGDLGALPALPLLAALPSGPLPALAPAVVAVPVLAGALGGLWLRRRRPPRRGRWWWRRAGLDAAMCGVLSGLAAGVLAWLASGPAGPGRMAVVGPSVWPVTAAVALEVAVGCAVVLAPPVRRRQPEAGSPSEVGKPARSWIQRSYSWRQSS